MIPYIEFSIFFEYRKSESEIQRILLSLCPFDHLPGEIIRIEKNRFKIQLFFPKTQSLETAYRQLEGKMEELSDMLNLAIYNLGGFVTDTKVGVKGITDIVEITNF